MKFIIIYLLATIVTFAQSNAQDSDHSRDVKSLVIVYDVTYPNRQRPTYKHMCFNKRITIICGLKIFNIYFSEVRDAMVVSNDCNESWYDLFPRQQFMIKSWRDEITQGFRRTIESTNSTKHILNFECKETSVRMQNDNRKLCSYVYTYEMNPFNSNYSTCPGLKGLVLREDVDLGDGIIQVFTAKSVTEQLVDSTLFTIPTNYTVLTLDEYNNQWYADKTFRKKITKEFKLDSGWKRFFKALLNSTPAILQATSKAAENISNIQNATLNTNSITPNKDSSGNKTNIYIEKVKCTHCNGIGVNPYAESTPGFGLDGNKWCDVCHKMVPMTHGAHLQCPVCKGKGYTEKYIK